MSAVDAHGPPTRGLWLVVLSSFPLRSGPALVRKSQVAPGKPPSDRPAQRRSTAPAVRIATTFSVTRIVESLPQPTGHDSEHKPSRLVAGQTGPTVPRADLRPAPAPSAPLSRARLASPLEIRMTDEVYVVDPGSYLGESTQREIAYAESLGKPVRYLSRERARPKSDGPSE